jgi:TetR/AcrR family transcriptional regulator, transcriptional repressor for nem operon
MVAAVAGLRYSFHIARNCQQGQELARSRSAAGPGRGRRNRTMSTAIETARGTTRGRGTRQRILDVAEESILAKGFDATSIEEIVAAAEITRSGFFYHFPDKNELARALIERYLETDRQVLDEIFARADELADDPLQAFLIGLKLFAEMMADLPNGHPGCIVASVVYQERLFDPGVHELNRQGVLAWRQRFLPVLERIAAAHPPRAPVDLVALADMVSTTVEGGIVMAKALREPQVLAQQVLLQRAFVKLLFAPA